MKEIRTPNGRLYGNQRLENIVEKLIKQGIVNFCCGGAIGFDLLSGFTVLKLKVKYPSTKLIMILPCRNQEAKWSIDDQISYHQILDAADEIIYVSEQYYDGCMRERNIYLVESSDYCVAFYKYARSGTAQTVRLAAKRGITIFNLANNDRPSCEPKQ